MDGAAADDRLPMVHPHVQPHVSPAAGASSVGVYGEKWRNETPRTRKGPASLGFEVGRSAPRSPPRQGHHAGSGAAAAAAAVTGNPMRRLTRLVPLVELRRRVPSRGEKGDAKGGEIERDEGKAGEKEGAREGEDDVGVVTDTAASTASDDVRSHAAAETADAVEAAAAAMVEMDSRAGKAEAGAVAGAEHGAAAAAWGVGARHIRPPPKTTTTSGGGGLRGLGAAALAAGRALRPEYVHLSQIHHLMHGGFVAVTRTLAPPPAASAAESAAFESGSPPLAVAANSGWSASRTLPGAETAAGDGVGRGGSDDTEITHASAAGRGVSVGVGVGGSGLLQPETAGRFASVRRTPPTL